MLLNIAPKRKLGRAAVLVFLCLSALFAGPGELYSQGARHIKVVLESQQSSKFDRSSAHASGSVIVRRDRVRPSGRLSALENETKVQRSTGIFTLVRDGGESILTVASRVPHDEVVFYRDYLTGSGYVARNVAFNDVGTSLKVSATILPDNQVSLRLTPRLSYFSPERSGAIDLIEERTELIVPNGQPVSLGGSVTKMHEVTRHIFGFSHRMSASEINLVVTATIQ
jgi:Bacterial type II and III secretion system protein